MSRLLIIGKNHEIPATAFQQIGRGLASQGHGGHARSAGKDNRSPEVSSSPTSKGGGRPLTLTAADLVFFGLCLLIFVGTPVWMVTA